MGTELVKGHRRKPAAKDLVEHRPATMSKEDFVRICMRHFSVYGLRWKWRVAEIFGRSWNTVWCYAAGRRRIPRDIADFLRELDRLRDEAEARIAARTPEKERLAFLRIMGRLDARTKGQATDA